MKRIAALLLVLLLFCSCGGKNRDYYEGPDLPPKEEFKISAKEATGTNAVFSVKFNSEAEVTLRKIRIQRLEEEKWVVLESLQEHISPEGFEFPEVGETAEWNVEFREVYGELSTGKYRAIFEGNRFYGDKKYSWFQRVEFSIDNPDYEAPGPEKLDITAEAHGWNRACGIKIFNNSDREIRISAMQELYYEVDGKFEKLNYIRGIGYDKTMISVAPGESYELSDNTEGVYGLLPIGKYRIDSRVVFDNDMGFENEQTVSAEFEVTGLEESGTSFLWEKAAELSGTKIFTTFRNDCGYEIRYGEDYFIQRADGEAWVTVKTSEIPAFDCVLYTLSDGETAEWSADLSLIYGELPKGRYRLVKPVFADADNYINGEHYVFFEFEIN